MTLTCRPASFTRFFSWLAPIRLEPMPASQAKTTSFTSSACRTVISELPSGWCGDGWPPDVWGRRAAGTRARLGRSSGGCAGRDRRGLGLHRQLLLGLLDRVEPQDHGSHEERADRADRDTAEHPEVLSGWRDGEVREDAARRRGRHEARTGGNEEGVG